MMLVDMRAVLTDAQWNTMRNELDRLNQNGPQQRPMMRNPRMNTLRSFIRFGAPWPRPKGERACRKEGLEGTPAGGRLHDSEDGPRGKARRSG